MKKMLSLLLNGLLFAVLTGALAISAAAEETTEKAIDVYFIAGQSNAEGCSWSDTITNRKSEYDLGYSNVLYYGCAYNNVSQSGTVFTTPTPVKLGMGNTTSQFGPEVGMAEFMSTYYNKDTGKTAIIIKYGVGAASLDGTQSCQWGAWLPPSMTSKGYSVFSGGVDLYADMWKTIDNCIVALKNQGYNKFNYCGFFWSQGEQESGSETRASRYGEFITALMNDFRNDLYTRTQNAEDKELYFVIAEICSSFSNATRNADGTSSRSSINTIVEQVRQATAADGHSTTLSTTQYTIKSGENGCKDQYHYSGDDQIDIGNRVGALILPYGISTSVNDANLGSCEVTYDAEGNGIVTFVYDPAKILKAVTLNGEDILSQVVDNQIIIPASKLTEKNKIVATFQKISELLTATYNTNYLKLVVKQEDGTGVTMNADTTLPFKVGTEVAFKVFSADGTYYASSVKFNGEKVTADTEGYYHITIVSDENTLIAYHAKTTKAVADKVIVYDPENPLGEEKTTETTSAEEQTTEAPDTTTTTEETKEPAKNGCGATLKNTALGILMLALGAVVLFRKRRKI